MELDIKGIAFEGSWVLLYPDESLVALDSASGGYPYRAKFLSEVKVWPTRVAAENYQRISAKENFELRQAFLAITDPK